MVVVVAVIGSVYNVENSKKVDAVSLFCRFFLNILRIFLCWLLC